MTARSTPSSSSRRRTRTWSSPLEITLERAERLVSACKGITLGVVLQHRFRPAAATLHDIVARGRLGKLVSAGASIPNWRPQSYYDQPGRGTKARDGGGLLLTQGIHTLDLLCWYAGEATQARSLWSATPVHRTETEDLACAVLRFSGGALGTVHATTTAYPGYPERRCSKAPRCARRSWMERARR